MSNLLSRRRILKGLVAATALMAIPFKAFARNTEAFKANNMDAALASLFNGAQIQPSDRIDLNVPEIAEDGRVVNVKVSTDLPGLQAVTLMVEANPNPLTARFRLHEGMQPEITTRIKMGGSSNVHAIVETSEGVFSTMKEVKVTLGGCGG